MVNIDPPGVPGDLVVEVEPAIADPHENVSGAGQFRIQNHPAAEVLLLKGDAI